MTRATEPKTFRSSGIYLEKIEFIQNWCASVGLSLRMEQVLYLFGPRNPIQNANVPHIYSRAFFLYAIMKDTPGLHVTKKFKHTYAPRHFTFLPPKPLRLLFYLAVSICAGKSLKCPHLASSPCTSSFICDSTSCICDGG